LVPETVDYNYPAGNANESVSQEYSSKTVISISHRLSTVKIWIE
jgi:hypothetical protein